MSQCGDFDYQLIEFGPLYDLASGQLYRAQIDSINRSSNTASVTLLDVCPTIGTADLTAVPFFYHCEFSTGTLEDLAYGHKAFSVSDIVYMLFAPAWGETAQRLYIIGHVDIRGTNICAKTDYVLIEAGKNGTSEVYVTLFDTNLRQVVDPEQFSSLPGSPSPPAQFPCLLTSSVQDWIGYNFSIAEWGANVGLLIQRQLFGLGNPVDTIISNSSNADDADPHTKERTWRRTYTGDQGFVGDYSFNYSDSDLIYGTYQLVGGPVTGFWRHSNFTSEFRGTETQTAGSAGWNMYDANLEKDALMPVKTLYEVLATNDSYATGIDSDWYSQGSYISNSHSSISVEYKAKIVYPYNTDEIQVLRLTSSYTGECTRTTNPYTYDCPGWVSGNIIHGPTQYTSYRCIAADGGAAGSSPFVEIINNGATILDPNTLIFATGVGKYGVYSVLYFRASYRESSTNNSQLLETVGNGGIYYYRHGMKTLGYTQKTKDSTFAVVTMFDEVPSFIANDDLPVEDCMKNVNDDVSSALGVASEELEELINDTVNGYRHDHYYVKVYNKKTGV